MGIGCEDSVAPGWCWFLLFFRIISVYIVVVCTNRSALESGAVFRQPLSGAATRWRLKVPPLGSLEPFLMTI